MPMGLLVLLRLAYFSFEVKAPRLCGYFCQFFVFYFWKEAQWGGLPPLEEPAEMPRLLYTNHPCSMMEEGTVLCSQLQA